ncbi:unnamed protein product, partial [Allacma fusca]
FVTILSRIVEQGGLKEEYNIQDLGNLESLMRSKIEERVNNKFSGVGETLTNKRGIVQAMLIFTIHNVFRATSRNICRVDAIRMENAEV